MKKNAKRLLAFLICAIMMVGAVAVPVSAATAGESSSSSGSDFSISDVTDILNALSYKEYKDKFAKFQNGNTAGMSDIVIDIIDNIDASASKDGSYSPITTDQNGDTVTHVGRTDVREITETGKVTWKFTVPVSGFYVIDVPYCQTLVGKTTSIERVLSINGEVPFAEARSVVLQKVWKYD